MDNHFTSTKPEVKEPQSTVYVIDSALGFSYLLREEITFERALAERGYMIDLPMHNGVVFTTDDNGYVKCFIGAIINQENDGRFTIEFDPPLVVVWSALTLNAF